MRPGTSALPEESLIQKSKKESVSGVRPINESGERQRGPLLNGTRIQESITIGQPIGEVYEYWRDFSNWPGFCKYLREVVMVDDQRSRWTVDGPAGKAVSWDAEIIQDIPNELISWQSVEGSEFENAGSVRFYAAPHDRGTVVTVVMSYNMPAGPLGTAVATVVKRNPAVLLREQLRRLKQLLETGEISTTEGQPSVIND